MKNIILIIALAFLPLNFCFARLEFLDGGIVNIVTSSPVLGHHSYKVYSGEKWKIINTSLISNSSGGQQFEVDVQAAVPFSKTVQNQTICKAVFSMDKDTFDYSSRIASSPSDHFMVDINNQQFISNLRTMLSDCATWTNWFEADGSQKQGIFSGFPLSQIPVVILAGKFSLVSGKTGVFYPHENNGD